MQKFTHEQRFLAYALFYGVLIGCMISAILEGILVPEGSAYLLTIQEHADLTVLAGRIDQSRTWIIAGFGATFLYILLLFPVLNPHINMSLYREPKKLLRFGVFMLAALLLTIGLASRLDSFFGNMNATLFMKISGVAIPIVWWSILGEIGIAGTLSSWKPQKPDIRTCILLAIAAYLLFNVLQLADSWSFNWFFALVSEVFAGTGELSLRGLNWLRWGIVVLAVCTSITAAAVIIGLAPVKMDRHERTSRLIRSVFMLITFTLLLTGIYSFGVLNYDLGKESLAAAIGAEPAVPGETHTAILHGSPIVSLPWDQEISPACMTDCGTLPVSSATISLLQQYLLDQPRSIYRYGAEDAIVKSWFQLWQSNQATAHQVQTQDDILQRMFFLNRLTCLPVTAENRSLLGEYEDDSKWWVGHRSALLLARAAVHFNEFTKAGQWLEVARKNGGSEEAVNSITIPTEPLLATGVISGTINTSRPVVIGLFRAADEDVEVTLDTTYVMLNLVASRTMDVSAPFSFENIGAGKYFLALRYDGKAGEITMAPVRSIELDSNRDAVAVGVIEMQ